MKKQYFKETDYVKPNGLSLQDVLMGPLLDHLIPFTVVVYDMKTNTSTKDLREIKWDSKYLSRRVFAFSLEEKDGHRTVTFDVESARPLTDRRLFRVRSTRAFFFLEKGKLLYDITYRGSVICAAIDKENVDRYINAFIQGVRHTLTGVLIDQYFKR